MNDTNHPIITITTTLKELESLGATTLSDIPPDELLVFVRHFCLSVAKNAALSPEMSWCDDMAEACEHIEEAIVAIRRICPK
jgi:hypothetical protein